MHGSLMILFCYSKHHSILDIDVILQGNTNKFNYIELHFLSSSSATGYHIVEHRRQVLPSRAADRQRPSSRGFPIN